MPRGARPCRCDFELRGETGRKSKKKYPPFFSFFLQFNYELHHHQKFARSGTDVTVVEAFRQAFRPQRAQAL